MCIFIWIPIVPCPLEVIKPLLKRIKVLGYVEFPAVGIIVLTTKKKIVNSLF